MYWINKRLTWVAAVSVLTGCGSIGSLNKPMLETDGERMVDIYREALQEGDTVDEQLTAFKASEGDHAAADNSTAGAALKSVDPAYLAVHGSKDQRYRHKQYTKLNGRYYSKKTGGEVTRFRCGSGTRIVTRPCDSSYGNVSKRKRVVSVKEDEKKLANDLAKAPANKRAIKIDAAEADRLALEEIERRRALAVAGNSRDANAALAVVPAPAVSAEVTAPPCAPNDLYCGFSRSSDNELQQLFPRLENPDIVVYITPHLATHNNVPVPGYTTAFPLYDEVHYALPGERVDP